MDWLFVRSHAPEPDFARFRHIEDYDDDYLLDQCIPLTTIFPEQARICMNPNFSDRLVLGDSISSGNNILVLNTRARMFFEEQEISNIEWLPVPVLNHMKKPIKEPYFIANILSSVDCIDTSKSVLGWNSIDPEQIDTAERLVLDEGKLPANLKLFRPLHLHYCMLISRTLADAIQTKGLTGFMFTEVAQFRP
jgi:hypothetical protein